MANYIDINPELLRWAIDRSGKPVEKYPSGVLGWLRGEKKPTFNQLQKFARQAMVPFGYLFLQSPPEETLPVPDYRSRQDEGVRRPSPNLIDTVLEMQRRQEWMREYLLEEGHTDLPFVGSATIDQEIVPLAKSMRETLGLADGWAEKQSTWEAALRFLRERIAEVGILLFVNGIVGNNTHRKLDPEEFQGFVLVDSVAPLVFVNGADFKSAQMFTLAHELVHVWVGQSALFDLIATSPTNVEIEKYCNSVAAELLMPASALAEIWSVEPGAEEFKAVARRFKVSPIVVARRACDMHLITFEQFLSFYRAHMKDVRRRQGSSGSGGDFWRTQNLRVGRRFGRAVIAAVQEGRLSYSHAYSLTGLHGDTFDRYASLLFQEEAP